MEALIFLNILIRSKSLEFASNFVEDIESGLFFPNKSLFFIPSTNFPLTTFKIYRKQPNINKDPIVKRIKLT